MMVEAGERAWPDFARGARLAGRAIDVADGGATWRVALRTDAALPRDAYTLEVADQRIEVAASSDSGFQYAGSTIGQLAMRPGEWVGRQRIEDRPAFPVRGVMLDISRDKVPTMPELFAMIDQLASWKINHFQLYIEHTFAYSAHAEIWREASPITAEEMRALDAYCGERHIELAANQNSFGHLHRWLRHPAYIHLAETPDGYMTPWGEKRTGPFSLNPLHPECPSFLAGLYDELLPNVRSGRVNVGCDETFDLGQGFSRARCDEIGKGRVYLEFLTMIHRLLAERGKTMLYWGDIILHHPELIPELPRDATALLWGYEADHPFAGQCRTFAEAGVDFWVCPGTSTWNSIAGRIDNALANMDAAAREGLAHGATGFMVTEWGDNGHWQTKPFSELALAAGACAAWSGRAPAAEELATAFHRGSERIAWGRVYLDAGFPLHNTSPIFPFLRWRDPVGVLPLWTETTLNNALGRMENIARETSQSSDTRIDAEIDLAASMLRHAVQRGLWLKAGRPSSPTATLANDISAILHNLQHLWLSRNRPGGLPDSLAPLTLRHHEYSSGT